MTILVPISDITHGFNLIVNKKRSSVFSYHSMQGIDGCIDDCVQGIALKNIYSRVERLMFTKCVFT